MGEMKVALLKEEKKLERILDIVQERMDKAPEGYLRISTSKNGISYYQFQKSDKGNGRYISRKNKEFIQRLAQKQYDEKVWKYAKQRLYQIKILVKQYEKQELEDIFYKEHPVRQGMIVPIEPIWEQRVEEWMQEKYQGKGFKETDALIYTERGERVRSKSEKILADFLRHHNIPYKYEHPLYLKGMGVIYPDFTILAKKTGEEVYWEHLGRMDDPGYAKAAIKKIQFYERNNIFVGEKLILTYETEKMILQTKTIERLVEKYVLDGKKV